MSGLIACEECDAVYRKLALGPSEVALCGRCGAELERDRHALRRHVLPLSIAGLCMYIIANVFPILQLEVRGDFSQATLIGSVHSLNAEGMPLVAFLVLATTILFPLFQLLALIYLLALPIRLRRSGYPAAFNLSGRLIQILRPWVMVEIFLLGVIVAFVKLTSMATVLPGIALWAFGALAFLLTSVFSFDPRHIYIRQISLQEKKGKKHAGK
ncbi:MAG TPA: paraquat-inducible protein A [Nitrosospira sp.]|nr:paraquat-inducible protein A [Nitrosospira sp.]